MQLQDLDITRAALLVAHPSHELRLHGWLQLVRPRVYVLTDGGGRAGEPSLQSTTRVLEETGSSRGSIYGRFTDLEMYAAFLAHNYVLFIQLIEELVQEFIIHDIEYVVSDASEGYNSCHDVCHLLTGAAVAIMKRRHNRCVAEFDYLVVGSPDECISGMREDAVWLFLDEQVFARKIAAARKYNPKLAADIEAALAGAPFQGVKRFSQPQLGGKVDAELSADVINILAAYPGLAAKLNGIIEGSELHRFRVECLRPVKHLQREPEEIPFYELYGERLVAAGHYKQVIRQREHFMPLAQAVWSYVESR